MLDLFTVVLDVEAINESMQQFILFLLLHISLFSSRKQHFMGMYVRTVGLSSLRGRFSRPAEAEAKCPVKSPSSFSTDWVDGRTELHFLLFSSKARPEKFFFPFERQRN